MCADVLGADADSQYETLPWLIENKFIISQNGKLSANFPVFEDTVFDKLLELLKPIYEEIADCMIHRLDGAAFVMEALIDYGALILPREKTPICVYGVKV